MKTIFEWLRIWLLLAACTVIVFEIAAFITGEPPEYSQSWASE
jgi:hypothetical protein